MFQVIRFTVALLALTFILGFSGVVESAHARWSVDQCEAFQKWHYNNEYGVFVGNHDGVGALNRCEYWTRAELGALPHNSWRAYAGVLDATGFNFSAAPPSAFFDTRGRVLVPTDKFHEVSASILPTGFFEGGDVPSGGTSDDPVAAVLQCENKSAGEIVSQGLPNSDRESDWYNECSFMPSLGVFSQLPSSSQNGGPNFGGGLSGNSNGLIFTGGGLAVPSSDYDIKGISKVSDLKTLMIGWTNFLLPYVSIISVFAIVAAGMFYIVSFVSDDLHTKAKSILMYVVIGIVLILSAFTIVNTLLSVTVR